MGDEDGKEEAVGVSGPFLKLNSGLRPDPGIGGGGSGGAGGGS